MVDVAHLAVALHKIGAVRFGDFVLKDGRTSPFYVDLRVLIGHPAVLREVATAMLQCTAQVEYVCLAGIPYAGLPLAVAMSLASNRPLVYPRKEAKAYGTKKMVEGVFAAGDRALVVDDVVTTGGAKLEAIAPLREAGLIVTDVVVVVDREQSGSRVLADSGIQLHSVLKVRTLLEHLRDQGSVAEADVRRAFDFIAQDSN
ncbi:MAG: orotate phosphoribosyltransferase [Deltaproteobacteria bacterium]|nr:orotate phosphoribosyltransferase [Deltaproteobacteria bacterium]